ncbi:MAG TPA: methyltransferase domain-containing protein [Rhodanobacteraceae bacterium]|nr:methyltransferase domain-containing protein [Rhodanobacteraceae bacterium]
MTESKRRLPHAALNPAGRLPKAGKIAALLELDSNAGGPLRLLEIGTGSGLIAHYFATRLELDCEVDAIDVLDQRQITEGYRYQTVTGVELPFAEGSFDVVISNHVIEHVGGADEQLAHLRAMARVLKPGGVAYLATPNRWQLIEPHYRLAFLSWLPKAWRSRYLRWRKAGDHYDCEPLSMPELESMLRASGLDYKNVCADAIRAMDATEPRRNGSIILASRIPGSWIHALRRFSPTHVYLLRPSGVPRG